MKSVAIIPSFRRKWGYTLSSDDHCTLHREGQYSYYKLVNTYCSFWGIIPDKRNYHVQRT